MNTIYIDESGYTGEDLLHPRQSTFAIATHNFTPEECAEFKQKFFRRYQGPELKHVNLGGGSGGQKMVIDFLRNAPLKDRISLAFAHKPYSVVRKMVEFIFEESVFQAGYDIYADGFHIATANLWWAILQHDRDLLNQVSSAFQRMIRYRTQANFAKFATLISQRPANPICEEILDQLNKAFLHVGSDLLIQVPKNALDVSPIALAPMHIWRQRLGTSFSVIHDASSNMAKHKAVWDALTSDQAPEDRVGMAGNTFSYPIGVTRTTFESSKESPGIQIADVLAGVTSRYVSWFFDEMREDSYAESIGQVLFMNEETYVANIATAVIPENNFDRQRRPEGTEDPLAYTARAFLAANLPST